MRRDLQGWAASFAPGASCENVRLGEPREQGAEQVCKVSQLVGHVITRLYVLDRVPEE